MFSCFFALSDVETPCPGLRVRGFRARRHEMRLMIFTSSTDILFGCRGSNFLKKWMEFLEENADLRYPDLSTVEAYE